MAKVRKNIIIRGLSGDLGKQLRIRTGTSAGRGSEWRNRLVWGDKKYVLPALLDEFAGQLDLIYS